MTKTTTANDDNASITGSVAFAMPQTFSLEQPTMALRWFNGVLEQAFTRTSSAGSEIIWKAVPSVNSGVAADELERLSAGPSCEHEWEPGYDNHKCGRCGAFRTDGGWGIASRMVFKSRTEAEFYQRNGRYPEAQRR